MPEMSFKSIHMGKKDSRTVVTYGNLFIGKRLIACDVEKPDGEQIAEAYNLWINIRDFLRRD